eukprot:2629093-Rhodomonas_salina.1
MLCKLGMKAELLAAQHAKKRKAVDIAAIEALRWPARDSDGRKLEESLWWKSTGNKRHKEEGEWMLPLSAKTVTNLVPAENGLGDLDRFPPEKLASMAGRGTDGGGRGGGRG